MKLNKLKKDKGFTLIELIIALSIISIISMVFFNIISSNIKYNAKNEKDIKALNIAQTEIENIRNYIKSNTDIYINGQLVSFNEENTAEYKYSKILQDDVEYTVKVNLSKEEKSQKSQNKLNLYTIDVEVKAKNENLSKKTTTLSTSILSK